MGRALLPADALALQPLPLPPPQVAPADTCPARPPARAATWRLRLTLRAGAVLATFCLLMLAANAALTFHVVRLAGPTTLGSGGKLTDRTGSLVVGE